ncbi:HWE histidine kinase domain-containing protein [Bauldia litoralis]|uniref:HWE histidine kinase domain-containing protein n=1 Tax=Bauldia litoralis TaxID=665467 RepID=UPI003266755B
MNSLGQTVDLTNCDREPIHLLGMIQSHGCLLVLSETLAVLHASETAEAWFRKATSDLIGTSVEDLLPPAAFSSLKGALSQLRSTSQVERDFGLELATGQVADMAVHVTGRTIIVEFEPSGDDTQRSDELVRSAMVRLGEARGVKEVLDETTRVVRQLIGYDRVMVYRFLDDGTGEVVAEDKIDGLEPFLGLRYPPTDIPRQARELYKRNLIRSIADVGDRPSLIQPPAAEPVDLSFSVLRSVSPIHIEYLTNMGVGASMSLSIMRGDDLWGLVACHHSTPRQLSLRTRSQAELFSRMLSLLLESREQAAQVADEQRVQALHGRMMAAVSRDSKAASIINLAPELTRLLPADGIGVWIDDGAALWGQTPSPEEFLGIVRFLNQKADGSIYATRNLAEVYPRAADFSGRAAGLMAIPLSRESRDYLVLFRREVVSKVIWAGNPEKPAQLGPNGVRLTPRKSFEAWQEMVRGESDPWRDNERRIGEVLRATILEVILRLTSEAEADRRRAQEKQDLLIAELNHRSRNMLGLVRSIIRQSRAGHATTEEYVAVLGDRIQALARAHDQITDRHWSPISVRGLVEAEADAYLNGNPERLVVEGDDVLIDPTAFSSLALVIHEMMTNATKYGALNVPTGRVTVALSRDSGGRLVVDWTERGGPPVQAPKRRGFGSTIIERSIPFDLKGEADIHHELAGVRARFVIPANYAHDAEPAAGSEATTQAAAIGTLSGHVLIVEDNLLVAMDAEDIVTDLGATSIETAADTAAALTAIEARRPGFALLDINLGSETSLPVAKRLRELGVTFAFVTGYGERAGLPSEFDDVPRLSKPFTPDSFRDFLTRFTA